MKIRNRITLWASLAGLITTVILSAIVFIWGLETPYEFLDQELEIRARTLANEIARERIAAVTGNTETLELFANLYWAKIYDTQGQLLFDSALARKIEMPMKVGDQGYLVSTNIPLNQFYAEEDEEPAGSVGDVELAARGVDGDARGIPDRGRRGGDHPERRDVAVGGAREDQDGL